MYLKYFLVIFIFVWVLGVLYMFFTNGPANSSLTNHQFVQADVDNDIDQYRQELSQINSRLSLDLNKANEEIRHLKELNEQNQDLIAQLK